MSMASVIAGLNGWMMDRKIFITDFDPYKSKMYIAILGDGRTEDEVLTLARETKTMLTIARIREGVNTSDFGLSYKTIGTNQIPQVRKEGLENIKKLEDMIKRGEIIVERKR